MRMCAVMSCQISFALLYNVLYSGPTDPYLAWCLVATISFLLVNARHSLRDLHRRLPLRILNNVTHERSTQQNRRLVQIVVLVAQRSHTTGFKNQTRVVRNVLANPTSREGS